MQYHTHPFEKQIALPSACRLHNICSKMRICVGSLWGSRFCWAASMWILWFCAYKVTKSTITTLNSRGRLYLKKKTKTPYTCALHTVGWWIVANTCVIESHVLQHVSYTVKMGCYWICLHREDKAMWVVRIVPDGLPSMFSSDALVDEEI